MKYVPLLQVSLFQVIKSHICTEYKGHIPILQVSYLTMHIIFSLISPRDTLIPNFTGTDLKKTGTYFIQWKDVYTGRIYGLNFFTEAEALRFLSSCFVSDTRALFQYSLIFYIATYLYS